MSYPDAGGTVQIRSIKSRLLLATAATLIASMLTTGPAFSAGDPNNPDVPSDCTLSHRLYIGGDYAVEDFQAQESGATASSDFAYWEESWDLDSWTRDHLAATSTQTIKNTTGSIVPTRTLYNLTQEYVYISTYRASGPSWPMFMSTWDEALLGYVDSQDGVTRIYKDLAYTDQLLPSKTVADLSPEPPPVMNYGAPHAPATGTLSDSDPVTIRPMASKLEPGETTAGLKNRFYINAGNLNMNDPGLFTWSYITAQVCAPIPTIVGTTVVLAPNEEPPVQTLTGTGTYVGDQIEVFDPDGNSIGTTVVLDDHTWSLPGVTIPIGTHTYSVSETDFFELVGHNDGIFKVIPTPVSIVEPPELPTNPVPKTPKSLPNTGK
ncbi:MAG TPA: hypothetical protein PKM12_06910 [Marmoricola sp.]|nr:hypothetical protein [Marmoricola sp.]